MNEFAEYVNDVFRLLGPVSLRRMFSSYGIFYDGIMFGLLNDDRVYLKADEKNVASFQELGLQQFTYTRQGKIIGLSYYQAPDCVMDDPTEAALWARRSFEAALRATPVKANRAQPRAKKGGLSKTPRTTAR